jgi:hypothetical protein
MMKRMLVTMGLAALILTAGVRTADAHVGFSIGIGLPGIGFYDPYYPPPVAYYSAPAYYAPPVYYYGAPAFYGRAYFGGGGYYGGRGYYGGGYYGGRGYGGRGYWGGHGRGGHRGWR